jgi:PAS domain S-box-containing protein
LSNVSRFRHSALPLAVLTIGLVATALVSVELRRTIATQDRERFTAAAENLHDTIRARLETYIAILRASAGLMAAADGPTAHEFRAFVDRLGLQQRYPGIQGIGYTARIPAAELESVVAAERREGRPNFRVWPEEPRAEYHAILYLEPLDQRNVAAIGYDMFTEATRREAMERARDTGEAAASGIVTLVQEIDEAKQPGFLIYLPVYEGGGIPATVEERRARLRGFVYSPFRAGDLFAGVLGSHPRPRVAFELFDGPASDATLINRSGTRSPRLDFTSERVLDVAGRQWTAHMVAAVGLQESSNLEFVPVVLWGGIGVTLLLTGLALMQARARVRAEQSELEAAEASQRFRQLANSIPQLAWMARPDGYIYWYNDRWYEYTGATPADMEGWGWQRVHDPRVLPAVMERWQHSIATGEPFEMEFPLASATGEFRWFLTRIVPLRDARGSLVQWFGTNTDVQYRHDAEHSLQQQAETLAILNRTGTQLAGELDLDRLVQAVTDAGTKLSRAQFGAFFYNNVNDAGESYTLYTLSGVPRESFTGFPMPRNTEVFAPTFRGDGIIRSDDITKDPRYGKNAPYHGMPKGHLPVRSYLAVPVKSRSGEVLGGLFFGHAQPAVFTEQVEQILGGIAAQTAIAIDNARLYKRVQQLLDSERVARAEAERVSRMKDEFLAVLSHELRTPLNAVMGWAHMLSAGALPEDKRTHATDSILRNAKAQSRLIEDLLDMSRIISGRLSLELAVVDLCDVVDAAVNMVRPSAVARDIELTVTAPSRSFLVRGDAGRLQQTVWNLLTNAIKFTPAGGHVRVELHDTGERVVVSVIDTGAGIAPEFLPHVFDRFRQADASVTRGHGGLGLGLSIVRSLVELHGGTVHASSAGANQGATFTIELPKAAVASSSTATAQGSHDATGGTAAKILDEVSVLVVDDDADGRELAVEVLRQQGAHVTMAGSAAEALEMIDSGDIPIDLIVSDVGMPDLDGYEFMRRVRGGSSPWQAVPAIALTAYAGGDDRKRALAAGYDVHLAKPVSPSALVRACASLCEERTTP